MAKRSSQKRRFALITGAAGGIGTALVRGFADAGYSVIATDIKPVKDARHFIKQDLEALSDDRVARAFQQQVAEIVDDGHLAALVNNAALQIVKPVKEVTTAEFARSLAINTTAPFALVRMLLPELERAGGSVVNISSIHGALTKPHFVAYATTKAALTGLTRALAVELGARVRINAIAPAAIATPMLEAGFVGRGAARRSLADMHPVGRVGDPAEVASLAVFLASDQARFINGAIVELDGGISSRLHDPS